jgi:hypothetical protein
MAMSTVRWTLTVGLLLLASSAQAGLDQSKKPADAFPSDVASVWFDALYDVVRSEGTSPPAAARIYGVAAVALYEAVAPGTRNGRSLAGQLKELSTVPQPNPTKKHHWPTVASTALAQTIRGIFPAALKPASLEVVAAVEAAFDGQFSASVPGPDYERSVAQGQAVAGTILDWAATDGFAESNNCRYIPVVVLGAWVPTPPAFAPSPLQPCWGQIRPMVLTSGEECTPSVPPRFSVARGSPFFAAAQKVYDTFQRLTPEQTTIAGYWADGAGVTGTPPGHWVAIVGQLARNDDLSLAEAAEAYARVGIAVNDAFIQCWNVKYALNLQRPVTYIQQNIDRDWLPLIPTPNFPTYTSGHSTQSGAAARVLTDMFGVKPFKDTLHADHGLVPAQEARSFASFDEAAAEAAVSRLYGGIHYTFDNDDGLAAGHCVGQAIIDRVRFRR